MGTIKPGKGFRNINTRLKTYYDITDGIQFNSTNFELSAATKESIELFKKHPSVGSVERRIVPKGLGDRSSSLKTLHTTGIWINLVQFIFQKRGYNFY